MTDKFALFDRAEYDARIAAVRRRMAERGLDALVVTSPENVYYLTGLSHQGYFAFTMLVLPRDGTLLLATRSMERVTITRQVPDVAHRGFADDEEPQDAAVRILREAGFAEVRLGVELNTMFFPPIIWDAMREGLPDARWDDASGLTDDVRFVKSPAEIDYIRQAARMSDAAVRAGLEAAGDGVHERTVAAEVYRELLMAGSEYPGFVPLIRSSHTFLQEHVTWRDYDLQRGDSLFCELSGSLARYHAPLSRMAHIGEVPAGVERSAEIALAGLDAVVRAIRPGVVTGEVYGAWQGVIDEGLGHDRYRRHHCGYTVGIGFPPSWVGGSRVVGIRSDGDIEIREGMAFHLLSWIVGTELPDYVVSDTAIVGPEGAELVTSAPRELVIR